MIAGFLLTEVFSNSTAAVSNSNTSISDFPDSGIQVPARRRARLFL